MRQEHFENPRQRFTGESAAHENTNFHGLLRPTSSTRVVMSQPEAPTRLDKLASATDAVTFESRVMEWFYAFHPGNPRTKAALYRTTTPPSCTTEPPPKCYIPTRRTTFLCLQRKVNCLHQRIHEVYTKYAFSDKTSSP